jgi:hypothetical protein
MNGSGGDGGGGHTKEVIRIFSAMGFLSSLLGKREKLQKSSISSNSLTPSSSSSPQITHFHFRRKWPC